MKKKLSKESVSPQQESVGNALGTDTLQAMFDKQIALQSMACNAIVPKDDPDSFYLHATACIVELSEAIQCDNRWKHMLGGKRKERVDSNAKLEELVDAMHFLINSALYSGFTCQEFAKAFFDKGKVNVERQTVAQ